LNIDEPLTRITGSTIRHYVKDALGSVIALTDDTGAVRTTYTYDPFGNVTVSGETSDNPFQYTGRENDGTELYYYRARYYSPELQRFISEDPIRLAGGDVNYYAYVGNNPVNYTDPEGTNPIQWFTCGRYVDKYMKARAECLKERKDDSLECDIEHYDRYGSAFESINNLNCICTKMGNYQECIKTYYKCIKPGIQFPPKPR
jgi:RHS repeat-associated protein